MTKDELLEIFKAAVPEIWNVEGLTPTLYTPHPYQLSARHVEAGIIDNRDREAIVKLEQNGATCNWNNRPCHVPYDEHTHMWTLVLKPKRNMVGDDVKALGEAIGPLMTKYQAAGMHGVSFNQTDHSIKF